MRIETYMQATWDAMREEMELDPSIILMAEDIKGWGGGLGQYAGLDKLFGDRVLDTPISETAIVSSAVGAALVGLRPVIDLRFVDCIGVCMDEIYNQAAKSRYMFGGQGKVPMVIRCPVGIAHAAGAHHCQSLEAWFAHVPGLQVVYPSNAADAKGLLKTAIRNDNPVLFLEHKSLFKMEFEVPDEEFLIPFGKARVAREGQDVTIVSYGGMINKCEQAAAALEQQGVSAEIVDLRTISPWDKETVLASVQKTGKLVVIAEAVKQCGFPAEIAATVAEEAWDVLKGPIVRLGAPFVPVPMSPPLEKLYDIFPEDICEAVRKLVK